MKNKIIWGVIIGVVVIVGGALVYGFNEVKDIKSFEINQVSYQKILDKRDERNSTATSTINQNINTYLQPSNTVLSPTQQIKKVQVYVNIVDKDNKPFRPDKVEWYYPPVNGQATQYPAKCTNEACTRWFVTDATTSKIYVVANYKTPSPPGALCFSSAYDAKLVELSSVPTEITLTMKLSSYCY